MRRDRFRQTAPFFGAAALALAVASTASAQLIVCENFSYPDGPLVPNGGWANHSGGTAQLAVAGGQAVVLEDGSLSEDANIVFAPIPGNIYFGIDVSVDDLGAPYVGTDNEYFAHFRAQPFDFAARVDVVPALGGGDFSFGIASDTSTADTIWPTDLSFGTTYRVVVRYDQDNNIAELWVNPTASTDTSILGADQPDPGDTIDSFALRQSNSDGNETVRVDNLLVGATFDSVLTPVATCGTQVARFAATPNTGALSATYIPTIGLNWNPLVTSSATQFDAVFVSTGPAIDLPLPFGSLLCTIPTTDLIFSNTVAGTELSIPIPSDTSLIGIALCTQGAGINATAPIVELTNALDLTVGG